MNRTVKIDKSSEQKPTVKRLKGDKIPSRLELLEQALRNAKGTVSQLEKLIAAEKN